jgi:pilus assembly protein CpaB
MLVLAMVFAAGAVVLAQSWLRGQVQQPQQIVVKQEPEPPRATIVVARRALHYGAELTRQNVRELPWVGDRLPAGAFGSVNELFADGEKRIVLRTIEENEAVLKSRVSGDGRAATLSAVISQQMRAVTIRVNDVLGVAGFVIPGDRVDLMLTRDADNNRPETTMLLQNVQVLGIDQQASEDQNQPRVVRAVTLEVTPLQAQKITLGAQVGMISLALRNRGDALAAAATRVVLADLGVGEAMQPAVDRISVAAPTGSAGPSNTASIQVTRGLRVFRYSVQRDDPAAGPPTRLLPAPEPAAATQEGKTDGAGEPRREDAPTSSGPTSLLPSDRVNF